MVKPNFKPGEIKALLEDRGLNFSILARRIGHGMTRQRLAQAIIRPNKIAEDIIATALDLPPQTIWPQRYQSNGKRKERQPTAAYRPEPRFKRSIKS